MHVYMYNHVSSCYIYILLGVGHGRTGRLPKSTVFHVGLQFVGLLSEASKIINGCQKPNAEIIF